MKSKTYLRSSNRLMRHGISLFEVLVAILVAAIGIFGVIVLIPFAWETAERGIDRENAINAAKNQFADMQAYGYHNPQFWFDDPDPDITQPPAPAPQFVKSQTPWVSAAPNLQQLPQAPGAPNIVGGWPYLIDPLDSAGSIRFSQFPFFAAKDPPGTPPPPSPFFTFSSAVDYGNGELPINDVLPRINRINLLDSTFTALTVGLARRIATQQDDLVFNEPSDELGPPRQAYFSLNGGSSQISDVKRQFDGRYGMISFVVPADDNRNQYRMFTLVGRAGDRDNFRVFALADRPQKQGGVRQPFEGILLGGGDVLLTESDQTVPSIEADKPIRNGDWIMLINYNRNNDTEPMFDDIQMNFYQVLNASATDNLNEYGVALQGPDFDVFRDWPLASGRTQTITYAILIPNVLAVYERTFRAEQPSLWTNQ